MYMVHGQADLQQAVQPFPVVQDSKPGTGSHCI